MLKIRPYISGWQYWSIFIRFAVVGPQICEIREILQTFELGLLINYACITSLPTPSVVDFVSQDDNL